MTGQRAECARLHSARLESWLVVVLAPLFVGGCQAAFEDLRPSRADANDTGSEDAVMDALDVTGDRDSDLEAPLDDATLPDGAFDEEPASQRVLLEGTFGGQAGYSSSGTVRLVVLEDGSLELQIGGGFTVSSVPGPVVLLTTRASIGSAIDEGAGDIELGPLARPSGAQSFPAPAESVSAVYAWIYCKPFGVEIARAELMEVTQ